jgi:hypothetical protein
MLDGFDVFKGHWARFEMTRFGLDSELEDGILGYRGVDKEATSTCGVQVFFGFDAER